MTGPRTAVLPPPAVRVRGLVKRYGSRAVLDGVELSVATGEVFALLGPNGAGKTTLVEIIEGYRRADAGTIEVLGRDPWGAGPRHRARIGLTLQDGGVDPRARSLEVLRLYAAFYERPRDPAEVLDEVGLRAVAATPYRRLSGGEKQRLALGLALIGRPELLVLDEPTAGMDPAARAATRTLIAGLRRTGVTILLTTHDLGDVERLADRLAILDRGRIVTLASPAELATGGPRRLRVRLVDAGDDAGLDRLRQAIAARVPGTSVEPDGPSGSGTLTVHGADVSPQLVAAVAAACASLDLLVAELQTVGRSLEERYLELTGDRSVEGATGVRGGPGEGDAAVAR